MRLGYILEKNASEFKEFNIDYKQLFEQYGDKFITPFNGPPKGNNAYYELEDAESGIRYL